MLELFKQGLVEVDQADRFGDIRIEWTAAATPMLRRSPSTSTKDDAMNDPAPPDRALRAIEAIILVARSRSPPSCWPSCWSDRSPTSSDGAASWPPATTPTAGFQLVRVAGGYRYQTHPDLTPYVERFLLHDQRARLSGAALETLAIVAYKQPISRAQVASIRGVDPDGVLRTLQGARLHRRVGRDPGPARQCCTARPSAFLEKLGLDRIEELPPIAEFIPGADVVEALEAGLRITDAPTTPRAARAAAVGAAAATAARRGERLQKVLRRGGYGSRRVCEDLIAAGRVTVNGEVAVLGRRVDPDVDLVEVDGAPVGTSRVSCTTC